MSEQTVREQLVAALEAMQNASTKLGHSLPRGLDWCSDHVEELEAVARAMNQTDAALARHRAEPEGACKSAGYLLPCGPECPCYKEGANEGHSMGCNDDSCTCWAHGYTAAAERACGCV